MHVLRRVKTRVGGRSPWCWPWGPTVGGAGVTAPEDGAFEPSTVPSGV